ncbi:hypothetical protein TcasGA2_TC033323 [Tribolium castaneum]|uniref:Uncharacterized protein n=1 Tax=Tribolium castaneum TaxID=7070 RepID=A0A139WGU8_TRICA|nr:hypothetical protein TcasGA2_TC033323 [Tribolium castaneum]
MRSNFAVKCATAESSQLIPDDFTPKIKINISLEMCLSVQLPYVY